MPDVTAVEQLVHAARHAQAQGGAAAQERAAWHVLDWLGCAARGAHTPQGLAMQRWLHLQAAGPCATLAGCRADAAAAAAYHGALGSALEMDDVHRSSVLHPGPVVVPAALAAARADTTGPELLAAIIAGYEVMIRVGRALGPSHYKLWHTTATAGCFGAAAAAACVMRLDAATTAQALALAGTRAGGLWQVRHETSLGKAWHMAGAARDGLAAAQLAACGLTGPLAVLEGPSGWFAATAPDAHIGAISEARDEPWLFDVSFKPWPACRHAHPAMDALREALGHTPPRSESIERITVATYADALRFCDRVAPVDEAQARFSIQHALAAMLLWGEPQAAHYTGSALADPVLAALRMRVHVAADSDIQARYPSHYGAAVHVAWRDGSSARAELQDTYGDPARPMAPAALHAKAQMLMRDAGWSVDRIAAALAVCATLPGAPDLSAFNAVVQP
jgi:2-methylcitrate dehydratase PrpD